MMSNTEGELEIDVTQEREEGELDDSDLEGGAYIPLPRPDTFNPPSLVHMQIQDEQSDELSTPESSCSDSDEELLRRRAKRIKVKPRRLAPSQQPDKKAKYNVWCKALQEELLTEDMVSCDVSKKSRYGVESYDYTIKYRLDDNCGTKVFKKFNEERTTNKRRHTDRSNVKLRLGKRVNSHHTEKVKQEPKYLPNLTASIEDSIDVIAVEIAEKLAEEKKELIGRIVQLLGVSKAMELYKETQRIEADGGMLVMNGTRRRTPGGIYFFLLKRDDDISQEMVSQIFNEDKKETHRKIKKTRQSRQKVMEQLKQSLTGALSSECEVSRCESTVQSEHGSNPPPSPATDARDGSSDTDALPPPSPPSPPSRLVDTRELADYDDTDYLEVMCNDDMDQF